MVYKYPLTVNGVQFGHLVERDSYNTARSPVRGRTVTTIDGTEHFKLLGYRNSITVRLNPMTMEQLAEFCTAFAPGAVPVLYYNQQLAQEVLEPMAMEETDATYLSRCLYQGKQWTELSSVTITGTGVR